MTDIIVDGFTRVDFVPTIANKAAPTVAELGAGTRIDQKLIPNGLEGFEASPGEVDNSAFSSTFDTKVPGVSSFSGTRLIVKKQTSTDTVHDALTTFNTAGYIVVRDAVAAGTAYAAAQKVCVYPVTTGAWSYMNRERNSVLKYWVAVPISDAPELEGVVAA